jgi:hypothetical protein
MQQVVASICKADPEPAFAPFLAPTHCFIQAHIGAFVWLRLMRVRLQGLVELPCGNDGGAEFADDNAGGGICKAHELARRQFCCGAERGKGHHRVTGARHVQHILSRGFQMQRLFVAFKIRNALFRTGQQSGRVGMGNRGQRSGFSLLIGFARQAGRIAQFPPVWLDQGGITINREIAPLRVDDPSPANLSCCFDFPRESRGHCTRPWHSPKEPRHRPMIKPPLSPKPPPSRPRRQSTPSILRRFARFGAHRSSPVFCRSSVAWRR